MSTLQDLNKNKTVPANFNLLYKGHKGHNTGQKGYKDILGTKGTKQGHSGQKGRKGTFLALCFFLSVLGVSCVTLMRGLTENKSCLAYKTKFIYKLSTNQFFFKY